MKCTVKFVDVNRYTVHVELVTPATFNFDIEIPTSWIFIQIREKVLKVPEILTLMKTDPAVCEMVCSTLCAVHYDRTHPVHGEIPINTIVLTWGVGVNPNIDVTCDVVDNKCSCTVRYCTNVTTTVTRPIPGREGDLNVADILTELQRVPRIREGPRVHQLAMMAMVYCFCCLNIKGTTSTVRQIVFNVQE